MIIAFACKTFDACNLIREHTPPRFNFYDMIAWITPCSKMLNFHHQDESLHALRLKHLKRIVNDSVQDLVIVGITSEDEVKFLQSKGGYVYAVEHAIKTMDIPEISLHSIAIAPSTLKHLYNGIEKRSNDGTPILSN